MNATATLVPVDHDDIPAILKAYRRAQVKENALGPLCSLTVHVFLLGLALLLVSVRQARERLDPFPPPFIPFVRLLPPDDDQFVLDKPPPELLPAQGDENQMPAVPAPAVALPPSTAPAEQPSEPADCLCNEQPLVPESDWVNVSQLPSPEAAPIAAVVLRMGPDRDRILNTPVPNGPPGPVMTSTAVKEALGWLASVQEADGSWAGNPAHTGLALLCFLGYGETPLSDRYGQTVSGGLKWLLTEQARTGSFGEPYRHGIATYALADAYALTRIPALRAPLEQAVQRIVDGQQTGGGFDYEYRQTGRWDLSVTGWQCQALKAAYIAGATNPGLADAIRKAVGFCRQVAYRDGKFGYSGTPGTGGNMTGVGTVALILFGAGGSPEVRAAMATISTERLAELRAVKKDRRRWDETAGRSLYGWYYDTQAAYFHQDRDHERAWHEWRQVYLPVLLREQARDGYWEVSTGHGLGRNLGGRILATTWCCLQLEVPIRFLPSFALENLGADRVAGLGDITHAGAGAGAITVD